MIRRTLSYLLILGCAAVVLSASRATAQEIDPQVAWAALTQPAFDPEKVATVNNVTLERDRAQIILRTGTLAFARPVNGRVFAAAFRGTGVLSLAPELPLEVQQLKFHTGHAALETEFKEALFLFSDSTLEEVAGQVTFSSGDVAGLQKLYQKQTGKLARFGLTWDARLLHAALSKNPEPYAFFHAELKTDKYGWLLFDLDNAELEEVQVAQWDDKWRTLNFWCRFPRGGRNPVEVFQQPVARDAYRIQSYALDIRVDKKARLEGIADVKLTAQLPGQGVLLFSLLANLRVSAVTDASGASLSFFQPKDPKDRGLAVPYLAVVLPEPTRAEQELTLRFTYAGKRVVTKEGSGVFFASSFGWYPFYGLGKPTLHNPEFVQRYHFTLSLHVPKKYQAVAVGNKVKEYKEGGFKVTEWTTGEVPVAVAGFSFGSYNVHEEELEDGTKVQVFVNRQPDKYLRDIQRQAEQASIASGFEERSSSGPRGGLGGSPGPDARLASLETLNPARLGGIMVKEVANSLRLFEHYFGEYPYKKLAVANIPWSYGQGWPSLLYVSSLSFLDSTQRHVLFGGRLSARDQVNITDRFRAHETSHQWWGHVVGWKSYHDQWLSEGFAEYSGLLYALIRRGPKEFLDGLRAGREQLLEKDRNGAVYDEIGPIYAGQRLSSSKHRGGYSTIVYTKGGWALHMLRMMLMDFKAQDKDARFIAMMKDFTHTYYNKAASTDDFKRIAEKHMTQSMSVDGRRSLDWFFNQWVYGTGIPHFEVSYKIQPEGDGVRLSGTIKPSRVSEGFVLPVPLYAYQGERSVRLGWVNVTRAATPFNIKLPFIIDRIGINQWEDVLCTVKYKN